MPRRTRRRRPRHRRSFRRTRSTRFRRRPVRGRPRKRYLFKRVTVLPLVDYNYSVDGATKILYSGSISLDQLPNYTEFTNLFDQYRINLLKFNIVPTVNSNTEFSGTNPHLVLPEIWSVIDYDGTYPSTFSAMSERQNCKKTRGSTVHKRIYKPTVLDEVYITASTYGFSPKRKQWISTVNPNVPHFGSIAIIGFPGGNLPSGYGSNTPVNITVTMYLQFRNVK